MMIKETTITTIIMTTKANNNTKNDRGRHSLPLIILLVTLSINIAIIIIIDIGHNYDIVKLYNI